MKSYGRMSLVSLLLAALIAAGEGVALFRLWRENGQLRASVEQARKKAGDPAGRQARRDAELQVLRLQVQEMLKLRNEIRELRAATNELGRLLEESRQAKGSRANVPAVIVTSPAEEEELVPRERWTFAGYATPEATLQSWLWSLREGDVEAFQESLSPDGLTGLARQMQQENKTPEEVIAELKQQSEGVGGFQILDQNAATEDSVTLRVQLADGKNSVHQFLFTRSGNEWKMSDGGAEQ